MSQLSDAQRESINEMYFAPLTPKQLQQIEVAFLRSTPYIDWRLTVRKLYATKQLRDVDWEHSLCDILTFVQNLDWAKIYKQADPLVRDAMIHHSAIYPVLARVNAIMCYNCFKHPCQAICMPCRHLIVCTMCAIADVFVECPLCGEKIDCIVKIRS